MTERQTDRQSEIHSKQQDSWKRFCVCSEVTDYWMCLLIDGINRRNYKNKMKINKTKQNYTNAENWKGLFTFETFPVSLIVYDYEYMRARFHSQWLLTSNYWTKGTNVKIVYDYEYMRARFHRVNESMTSFTVKLLDERNQFWILLANKSFQYVKCCFK